MIIDLIKDELMRNFPQTNRETDHFFHLHCSPDFANALNKDMKDGLKYGFIVDRNESEPKIEVTKYNIPGIGTINVLKDMLQGYRLECVSCENKPEAALPESITILGLFSHLSNSYHADKNIFKKGDVLMDGRERYRILTDPMFYQSKGNEPDSWVYTLDKSVSDAVGKRLIKEYFKN